MTQRYRVVETCNLGGDYPDEKFVGPSWDNEGFANTLTAMGNSSVAADSRRCYKTVQLPYELDQTTPADARPMSIWAWRDAPEELRELSSQGGDWVALVPSRFKATALVNAFFGKRGNPFGRSSIERCDRPSGDVVFVGAHA